MSAGEIVRPNGKVYRPRKPPALQSYVDWSDDREAVVVLRTHDIRLSLELAADKIAELELIAANAHTDWWRLVPFDTGSGYERNWIPDPVRGTPCVVIPYE